MKKVGKYDQAQLLMNSAFESLKTSKHFCTKAMKYHLWQNDAAEASRCGQYFAYEAKNVQAEPDQHFLNSNFLRYVTYKTLNCIEHDQWREALISCFEVKKLIEEYHTSLYDLYIYSSYHGTMNMLTRAYDAYSAVLRTKDSLLAMILGYKLSMACHTQKLEFKFPHDRAKTPIDGAHQFLKMLFKGHPNLSLTHRMAVEYYVTTKNQVACLRSLNQLLKLTSSVTYEFYCSLFVEAFGAEGTLNDGITSLNVAAELRSATKQHDTEMPYGLLWAVNVLHGDEKKLFERQMACQETTSPEQRRLMKLNEVLKIL